MAEVDEIIKRALIDRVANLEVDNEQLENKIAELNERIKINNGIFDDTLKDYNSLQEQIVELNDKIKQSDRITAITEIYESIPAIAEELQALGYISSSNRGYVIDVIRRKLPK